MGQGPVDFNRKFVIPVLIEQNGHISREDLTRNPVYQRVAFLDVFSPQRTVGGSGLFDLWLRPLRFSTTPAPVIEHLQGSGTLPATLEFLKGLVEQHDPGLWGGRDVLFLGSVWEVMRDGMAYLVVKPRDRGEVQVRVFCGWHSRIDPRRTLIATVPYPSAQRREIALEEMTAMVPPPRRHLTIA